ncbi:hypothetical protein [Natrialba asiatica]|uniref:Uncharacterized protein n=1 Tax=Natrialba asiatica (strain ATCC 700177 / DSM 12278 / JCM 9576 / FERM P-10747 / NBRC 102637 / 172P1) TaxID=29540 RepID=M0AP85_NATA1|nr:hypothetical protein [Natrialba asiatica]ELY99193.1 hypothetical protein C481_15120 [Natrialba asiatica DSM 12278]
MAIDDQQTADEMEERVGGPVARVRLWVQMDANRWLLAGMIALVFFGVIFGIGLLDASPFPETFESEPPTVPLFQALIISLITGVTLIVGINLLVISEELDPLGDLRDQVAESTAFRGEVEELLGSTSPPEPAAFLRALLKTNALQAGSLKESVAESSDEAFREDVTSYADEVLTNEARVSDRLSSAQFGTFAVVRAAIDYNYSWKIYQARKLREEYEGQFDDEMDRTLDDLIDTLTMFGPAREHVKTLYFQWQFIDLSRAMLYTSLPPLAGAILIILYMNAEFASGTLLGVSNATWVVPIVITLALFPFCLLLSYVVRIGTVAKRTLAPGPFILRETDHDRDAETEW